MKTIIIINDQGYISGGLAKIAINSAISLSEQGNNVVFFYALGPVDENLKKSKVKCICIGGEHIGKTKNIIQILNGLYNLNTKRELVNLIKNYNLNDVVIHIHGWTKAISASVFSVCKKYNLKTYVTAHDYFLVCQNGGLYNYKKENKCKIKPGTLKCYFCNCDKYNYIYKMYRNVRQLLTKKILKDFKYDVIFISEFSKNILIEKGIKAEHTHLVYNHVEMRDEKRINVEKNNLYAYIARVDKDKGIDLFCKNITIANLNGIVIGDGKLIEEYRKKYPNIIFTGWLNSNEMTQYIKKIRCLIVTSKWYETMGLTIIEMQSCGIPCIVPDNYAGKMYIRDKIDGLYYDINREETLRECINLTRDDKFIEKLSLAFYDNLNKEKFSMNTHVNNLLACYNGEEK